MTRLYDPWSSYRSPYHSGGLSGAGEGRGQTDPRRLVACAQGAAPVAHDNTEFDGSFRRPEEARGWGDQAEAQRRLHNRYGIPFWALERLRTGRAKTVEAGLYAKIRAAYLDLCQRQVRSLQHEIAIEKAINEDVTLEDLEREASALAAKIAAKKADTGKVR